MIRKHIVSILQQCLQELHFPQVDFVIEHPADEKNGDFSTNVAMKLFGVMQKDPLQGDSLKSVKSPRQIAETVKKEVDGSSLIGTLESPGLVKRIEIAGPGFINFYLSEQFFISEMKTILDLGEKYGRLKLADRKRIVVEYTDPNPFKEFHVGHLYSNVTGEAIAKLLEATGAHVWRADFFGDVGMHVAKALWGLLKLKDEYENLKDMKEFIHFLEEKPLKERIELFGKAYSVGATAYAENELAKEAMKQINFLGFKAAQEVVLPQHSKTKEVDYEQFIKPSDFAYEDIRHLYAVGRKWSLSYFETIYARLGTKFDGYYPESLTGEYGYGMIMDALSQGIFEKGDKGAVIFPGEKYGLHSRVFINSLGLPTYEAKDFGNAVAKSVDFPYDASVIVTGNEINEYFNVMLMALRMYKPALGEVTTHIGHGMVRLPQGKMSSRTGKIIRGEDVLDEAVSRVKTLMAEREMSAINETAELIAQAAIKYAFLKQSIGKDISFDFDSSLSFEGNSGPYLQYTVVRARAVLTKSQTTDFAIGHMITEIEVEEAAVLRWLYQYPEVVSQAAKEYSPHLLATYLYELAQRFNSFYNKHNVLMSSDDQQRRFRLSLTASTAIILTNGLRLLGIQVPERM